MEMAHGVQRAHLQHLGTAGTWQLRTSMGILFREHHPPASKVLALVPGGHGTQQDQAQTHFPLQKGNGISCTGRCRGRSPTQPRSLLPRQDTRRRVNAVTVLGYCAAQGLTRARTRRQEGVKHLSGLICRLQKGAVGASFLPTQGCREVGRA